MKVNVCSSSSWLKETIIEADSIDAAIHKIQNDKDLIEKIINIDVSDLCNNDNISTPTVFVVDTNSEKEYDISIEIYDNYRE